MADQNQIICPSCGFRNRAPLPNNRCVSCGAKIDDLKRALSRQEELAKRYSQEGFSVVWFFVALVIMTALTAALVMGLPMVVPTLDFEGSAGMLVAIPVWMLGGVLIGLVSPGKTFVEPVVAAFLVALPTVFFLFRSQTVKTMPYWMYILMAAVGILFALIGAYVGERIQMGPPPKATD
jgi:hypothetical protein